MTGDMVTCIMVTGHQDRGNLPRRAIECFRNQTYSPRELIILNQNPWSQLLQGPCERLQEAAEGVGELREYLTPTMGRTLGELRSLGLERAVGDWFMSWDDDDWHHPERIASMMERRQPGMAVVPTSHIRFAFPTLTAWQYNNPKDGAGGLGLFPLNALRYLPLSKDEDTRFYLDNYKDRRIIWDNSHFAHMYLRFYHGQNTGDADHVMKGYARVERFWRQTPPSAISLEAASLLKHVLERDYDVKFPSNMHWHQKLNAGGDCVINK